VLRRFRAAVVVTVAVAAAAALTVPKEEKEDKEEVLSSKLKQEHLPAVRTIIAFSSPKVRLS
jgi:hypothetical protein